MNDSALRQRATKAAAAVTTPSSRDEPAAPDSEGPPHERRNFWVLVIYQVVLRAGWIFKTESVVMPHAADDLDPSGLTRGWLPLLNRLGQSVPPLLAAGMVRQLPKKQTAFIGTTAWMTCCFLGLTSLWLVPGLARWRLAPVLYLGLYALFFAAIGVNQLVYNTIQGKLIRPNRRGRLLMLADFAGASLAVLCAVLLLMRWLHEDHADYAAIFGFTTGLFAAASAMSWLLVERPDPARAGPLPQRHLLAGAWQALRENANFRRLTLVAALFSTTLVLFPHYQALARQRLGLGTPWLVWWVVAQNAGTAFFSLITGPLADAHGNRRALSFVTLLIVGGPLAALAALWWPSLGRAAFPLVFALVGLTPVAQKTFNNYTLEIVPREHHPRYLSTLNLSMALPIAFSPLASLLIRFAGFETVFLVVVGLLLAGWLLSFGLEEPRHLTGASIFAEETLP
jgi:predicted MFS family arabinose efflux permease